MTIGLSLGHLAQVVHADKQRMHVEQRFTRQVEMAQKLTTRAVNRFFPWQRAPIMTASCLVIRLVLWPIRLSIHWT